MNTVPTPRLFSRLVCQTCLATGTDGVSRKTRPQQHIDAHCPYPGRCKQTPLRDQCDGPLTVPPSGANALGGVKVECSNCGAIRTPFWRRGLNDELDCNACGVYCKRELYFLSHLCSAVTVSSVVTVYLPPTIFLKAHCLAPDLSVTVSF